MLDLSLLGLWCLNGPCRKRKIKTGDGNVSMKRALFRLPLGIPPHEIFLSLLIPLNGPARIFAPFSGSTTSYPLLKEKTV